MDAESAGDVKAGVELEETSVEADGETVTVESTRPRFRARRGCRLGGGARRIGELESQKHRQQKRYREYSSMPDVGFLNRM